MRLASESGHRESTGEPPSRFLTLNRWYNGGIMGEYRHSVEDYQVISRKKHKIQFMTLNEPNTSESLIFSLTSKSKRKMFYVPFLPFLFFFSLTVSSFQQTSQKIAFERDVVSLVDQVVYSDVVNSFRIRMVSTYFLPQITPSLFPSFFVLLPFFFVILLFRGSFPLNFSVKIYSRIN